jgi:hypothetical protein
MEERKRVGMERAMKHETDEDSGLRCCFGFLRWALPSGAIFWLAVYLVWRVVESELAGMAGKVVGVYSRW